ncbi:MAG: cytochrome bc complex cytochrome b subunit [Candidatus Marinimicrobia bacterium]|nr:cytochrome bc complex cytochrome b subunit [Candidatus Neomarinimicrobiota bacterium]MCF7828490.1 cytochrome bc complex cytochrome b subunit [Candidatus Neomarinimicrobiota bacterium]MCF7881980.1 cytochrome bc complex cytochrome b subunit [Candidatus Neomarinimicrobiota bacterium]
MKESILSWLKNRYPVDSVTEFAQKKKVPLFQGTIWYYFGGITLFLFLIQVATGILLLFYYRTGADQAYESVKFLMTKVHFGWLIRSIHSWAANLMVLSAFIHMFSVFFTRAYRKPRELTWITGMVLFLLAMAFGFSGYLLPWNELAFFATKVGTDIVGAVPFVGDFLLTLLRGGSDVTGATLSRFFGFHVALFPGIFTLFLVIHLAFVQVQGMSKPIGAKEEELKTMPFFPNFVLRDLLIWLIVLNVLAILAVFFPWELGAKADPFVPAPAGIRPEWYFMFMFQTLKMLPAHIAGLEGETVGVMAFAIAGIFWILIPFFDRSSQRGHKSKLLTYIGIIVVIFILVMTILGYTLS